MKTPVPAVCFYISGHGFGHSIRQITILNQLQRLAPAGVRVMVRTSAPEWLFTRTVRGPFTWLPGETDTGVVQIDSLRLDPRATMERAAAFYADLPRRAREESELLRAGDARLVVADAPPLACLAAEAAGIPSVVCANFTWDWIYRDYVGAAPNGHVISLIRQAYSRASAGWRLPMHGGFDTIDPIVDLPFVARHAQADRTRADVRAALNLPREAPLALVSFGGFGIRNLPVEQLDCLRDWGIVLTVRGGPPEALPEGIHTVQETDIYANGLRYEDLVRAVDVVVTKPGYGIISDCVANDTAILYTSRGQFAEYDALVRDMPRFLRCRFVPLDQFVRGEWNAALSALRGAPPPPERPRTDGAEVVATTILRELDV